jgi:hypothetical protein
LVAIIAKISYFIGVIQQTEVNYEKLNRRQLPSGKQYRPHTL